MRAVDTIRRTRLKLRPFIPGSKLRVVVLCVTAALSGLAEAGLLVLVVQLAVAIATDGVVAADGLGPLDVTLRLSLGQTFALALGLAACNTLFFAVGAWVASRISTDALTELRKDIFTRFIGASWELQATEREGHLQELLSTHVTRVTQAILFATASLTALFNFLALMGSALLLNPVAAGAIFVAVTVLVFALLPLSRRSRRYSALGSTANIELVNSVAETVSLTQEVVSFGVGPVVRERFDDLVDNASRPFFRNRFLGKLLPGLYQMAAILLVLFALGAVSLAGSTQLTSLGAVVLILLRSLAYSQQMQTTYHQINDLVPYAEQLLERRAIYVQAANRDGTEALEGVAALAFDDVSFSYTADHPVLRHVSFDVRQGETIGIVGPSGSGKSTLLQLLLRLRVPEDGHYRVNGSDAAGYSLATWRRRIAFVAQESRLFSGTVAENIRFFRASIDDAAIERAARQAHIHDEILAWPLGYETPVGTRGGSVSGGQRQRISLARALAGQPDVILLDEPTSALDMHSEALVRQTLEQLKGTVTVFIVAHRLSTVGDCDRIMVFEDGVLANFAAPDSLVASNSFYREATRLTEKG